MDNKAIKRRGWIKNIALIFLSILLVLTFFSNTILNYSLPEVAVQYPMYGTITSKIRSSGTITANSSYEVSIGTERYVESVAVNRGDTVKKGDLLFMLEDTGSDALEEAKEQLSALQSQYQIKLMTIPKDYSQLIDALADAKEALAKAIEIRDNLVSFKNEYDEINAKVKNQQKVIDELQKKINEEKAVLASVEYDKQLYGSYSDAKEVLLYTESTLNRYKTELSSLEELLKDAKAQEKAAQSAYESANQAKQKFESDNKISTVTGEELNALLEEIASIEKSLSGAKDELAVAHFDPEIKALYDDYKNTEAALEAARDEYNRCIADPSSTAEQKQQALEAMNAAQTAHETARLLYQTNPTVKNLTNNVENYESTLSKTKETYAKKLNEFYSSSSLKSQLQILENNLKQAKDALDTRSKDVLTIQESVDFTKELLSGAQKAYDDAKATVGKFEANDAYVKAEINLAKYEDQMEKEIGIKEDLDSKLSKAKDKVIDSDTAEENVKSAQRASDSAQKAYDSAKTTGTIEDITYKNELDSLKKSIEKQQAEIERIQKSEIGTQVLSKVDGIISAINISAGKKASPNVSLMDIEIADMGYTLTCSITNEQSRLVREGNFATVLYYYWGDKPVLRVVSIKNDPSNPGKSKLVTMEVTGGGNAGEMINFTLGENSQSYDALLPNSAIREDTTGKYVLIVQAKSTPLGSRYTAKRVDIEVLASDEKQTAVSGLSAYGEQVITTSSKPISAGMQVRLAEK